MRNLFFLIGLILLVAIGQAVAGDGDAPLEARQALFAKLADGSIAGEDLLELQVEQLINELHYVQLEVERFSVDNSVGNDPEDNRYPHSVNQLVVETYSEYRDAMLAYAKPGWYPNPFTATGADDLNAMCVPFGWTEQAVGNFSYLLQLDDFGNVVGYMIVGYGADLESGMDINKDGQLDGVVITLSSGHPDARKPLVYYDHGRVISADLLVGEAVVGETVAADTRPDSPELVKAKAAKVKQGLHGVQIALERLEVISGSYPQSIDLTVFPAHSGYQGREPPYLADGWYFTNPLAKNNEGEANARCIPFGWTPDAPGNFSYLTQYDNAGGVSAYALVGYTATKENGMDIDGDGIGDGIVLILWSAREYDSPPRESGIYEYYNCGRIVTMTFTRPNQQH